METEWNEITTFSVNTGGGFTKLTVETTKGKDKKRRRTNVSVYCVVFVCFGVVVGFVCEPLTLDYPHPHYLLHVQISTIRNPFFSVMGETDYITFACYIVTGFLKLLLRNIELEY